jgi:hypothetical protein
MEELDQATRQELNLKDNKEGLVILNVMPGSPAQRAGLRRGDIVKQVQNQPVEDYATFFQALNRQGQGGENLTLDVLREGKDQKIQVALGRGIEGTQGFTENRYGTVGDNERFGGQTGQRFGGPSDQGGMGIQNLERRLDDMQRHIERLESRLRDFEQRQPHQQQPQQQPPRP